MDGIGLKKEFKEINGMIGYNGHIMLILMLLYYLLEKNIVINLIIQKHWNGLKMR
jgi:hypothetical protein